MKRAIATFEKLGMHKTELRNAVLFYVAMDDKKLAILGDKGINEAVPENFGIVSKRTWLHISKHLILRKD